MEAKKLLKLNSIIILVFAVITLANLVVNVCFGFGSDVKLPEGSPENLLLITQIFLISVSTIFMIPKIYVGIKGLRVAKKPVSTKAHIIWAFILLVFAALSFVSSVSDMINNGIGGLRIASALAIVVEIIAYIDYIKYAKAVAKEG